MPDGHIAQEAIPFFRAIAQYAAQSGVVIALEPNPPIYGTNFINTTPQAFDFALGIDSSGLKVNIDLGTMLHYGEPVSLVTDNLALVNHIHISEPKLAPIERHENHRELLALPFDGYFSIEMGKCGDLSVVKSTVEYIGKIARDV
jgi:sugar phosphate isomerase/epimerase